MLPLTFYATDFFTFYTGYVGFPPTNLVRCLSGIWNHVIVSWLHAFEMGMDEDMEGEVCLQAQDTLFSWVWMDPSNDGKCLEQTTQQLPATFYNGDWPFYGAAQG